MMEMARDWKIVTKHFMIRLGDQYGLRGCGLVLEVYWGHKEVTRPGQLRYRRYWLLTITKPDKDWP